MGEGASGWTDEKIQDLIASPKKIVDQSFCKESKEDSGNHKWSMDLEGIENADLIFFVFMRQNKTFQENYSIGLNYKIDDDKTKPITLIRYNGPHGENSRHKDGHYNQPHIHRITAKELESGSICPQESHREITDKYHNFDEAIEVFFKDISIGSVFHQIPEFFQRDIFHEH